MVRMLAVSDTHGDRRSLYRLLDLHPEARYLLHLGDGASDAESLLLPETVTRLSVAGNCDFSSSYPDEHEVNIGKVSLFLTHGHRYGVKHGLEPLEAEARRRLVSMALFGHTHQPLVHYDSGLYLVNPGSLRFGGTYAIIDIANGAPAPHIAHLR